MAVLFVKGCSFLMPVLQELRAWRHTSAGQLQGLQV